MGVNKQVKKTLFIKNALILTASSLILRFVGIIFKVWLALCDLGHMHGGDETCRGGISIRYQKRNP